MAASTPPSTTPFVMSVFTWVSREHGPRKVVFNKPIILLWAGNDGTPYYRSVGLPRNTPNDVGVLSHLAIVVSGMIAMLDFLAKHALADGTLVTVLDEFAMATWPIHALYPKNRHLLPKVRVFVDFLAEIFAPSGPPRRGSPRRSGRRA
ncbi:LysR substrate-binding domain-containing protein [Sorangium sp. So ce204]|uniref:LysR substrate-binding domain-containing protein n=1 Tax=Sorangium sp. So ce204 TaxID=3133288 RepID=UPI003F60769B